MLNVTRADYMLSDKTMQAGSAVKIDSGSLYDSLTKTQEEAVKSSGGVSVNLSLAAQMVNSLLQRSSGNRLGAAAGFDSFLNSVHQQILQSGKEASLLAERPNDTDDTGFRGDLAKQAANYLLVSLYGTEKLHEDISAENPFAELDRLSLSMIAFNDSGAFTAAERQVAFLTMSRKDTEFRNQVFDLGDSLKRSDETAPWGAITSYLGDAKLASAMGETERAWRGWESEEALLANATRLITQSGVKTPDLPTYANLKGGEDSILLATSNKAGVAAWKNIPVKQLTPEDARLTLLALVAPRAQAERASPAVENVRARQVASYVQIDGY